MDGGSIAEQGQLDPPKGETLQPPPAVLHAPAIQDSQRSDDIGNPGISGGFRRRNTAIREKSMNVDQIKLSDVPL
jgi:hypothetical protein